MFNFSILSPLIVLKMFYVMAIFFTTTSIFAENKSPKVIVIGAGLAGLTTAYRLQQKGIDVDVYEARNRVGGRIFTVYVNGNIAELGGQNITDGGEAKNIYGLVKEFDLELTGNKVNMSHAYFTNEGLIPIQQLLSDKQFHPHNLRNQLNELISKSQNMREILNGILEEEDPLYKTLAVRLAAYEGATAEKLSPLYAETLFHMLLGGISAVHRGSRKEENYVNLISIKGGNALLPEKIAEVLGNRLHLNKPLSQISKDIDDSFVLTFYDGQKVKADILVLTIPCSIYDKIVIGENVIPLEKLEAIKHVQYGTNAKILVPFSHSPLKRIGLINDRIVSFFDVKCNILTLYYTGTSSLFSADTILNTYSQDRPMIEMSFGDVCPSFIAPVFAEDRAFATYDGVVGYSWPNDPYAKGSYSYISPGQETLLTEMKEEKGEVVKTLFAPIDQKLYFAGEHTSILMDVSGTMEAACESGERVARMILNDR